MPSSSKAHADLARLIRRAVPTAFMAGLLLLIATAWLGQALALGMGFIVKVMLLFTLTITWLGAYLPEHLPHASLGPANLVTLGRMALTALLAGFVGESQPAVAWLALGIAVPVLVLDGFDGWLARRRGWASEFGARFDMETDALLILLLAMLTWQLDKAGAWVLLSGMLRYMFMVAAAVRPWLRQPLQPNRRRRALCAVQIFSLLLALAPSVSPPLSNSAAATGLLLLCYSFIADIVWLRRHATKPSKETITDEHPQRFHSTAKLSPTGALALASYASRRGNRCVGAK